MTVEMNWKRTLDDDAIVSLSLDLPGRDTNILQAAVIDELGAILAELHRDPPKGLIIRSAKPNGFIAGADVNSFSESHPVDDTIAAIQHVQHIFSQLEALPCPTVALIHGFCLGGGLELALACQYRIAEDNADTRIGLPEVKLGIHPGYGGSVRLIERLGVIPAMTLMLAGRIVSARAAARLGIIDRAVPHRHALRLAREFILNTPRQQQAPWYQRYLSCPLLRPLVAQILRYQTAKQVNIEHYPAPFALIDCWRYRPADREAYFAAEASSVAALIQTPQAQSLVRLFDLQQQLKSYAKQSDFKAAHVHVIGAGVMGGDIAAWCALRGLTVTLQDQSAERIAPALKRAHALFTRRLKQAHLIRSAFDRLTPDILGAGVASADVVIEAIFEDLDAKQAVFKSIEPQLRAHAILATNTSSIPIESIADCLAQPDRLIGIHFFNPVAKMQLVEIVSGPNTVTQAAHDAAAFVRQIGRLPLPVTSSPGFLVNRVLMPYLLEAVTMAEEGISAMTIDQSALAFGMPMGPLELADHVGLDICLSVANTLAPVFNIEVPETLSDKVAAGHLGRKTGQGFYSYQQGKKSIPRFELRASHQDESVQQRLVLRLLNECLACLNEGIVDSPDLLDAGLVFGTGFAPFRGGPMHYLAQQGGRSLHQQLEQLEVDYGRRFSPHQQWEVWL